MTLAIAFCRVAALCLLGGAAHASTVPAADASAPVPATRYQPTAYQAPAAQTATPDRAWREQNRIVAAYDSMALTMPAHAAHSGHAAHASHAAPASGADPHAGHAMPAADATDPHAGHRMAHTASDPHAAHQMHTVTPAHTGAARLLADQAAPGKMACCKGKDDAHAAMGHGAATKASCCQGKGGAHDGAACMAPGAAAGAHHGAHGATGTPAQCGHAGTMADKGKPAAAGCCGEGACCKDGGKDCCGMTAAHAAAHAATQGADAHQHGGHH